MESARYFSRILRLMYSSSVLSTKSSSSVYANRAWNELRRVAVQERCHLVHVSDLVRDETLVPRGVRLGCRHALGAGLNDPHSVLGTHGAHSQVDDIERERADRAPQKGTSAAVEAVATPHVCRNADAPDGTDSAGVVGTERLRDGAQSIAPGPSTDGLDCFAARDLG